MSRNKVLIFGRRVHGFLVFFFFFFGISLKNYLSTFCLVIWSFNLSSLSSAPLENLIFSLVCLRMFMAWKWDLQIAFEIFFSLWNLLHPLRNFESKTFILHSILREVKIFEMRFSYCFLNLHLGFCSNTSSF